MRFQGKIIRGHGIGRQLSFPTLNFEIPDNFVTEYGVYAARISWDLKTFSAILFFGRRETFDGEKSLEVHILDEEISEAPQSAEVEIFEKIRDVRKFTSEEELKKQIVKDCATTRRILKLGLKI
ncbi:riboflavin kinase [Candidatus Gracilibacteria bacterium]|nr:riboflavin kinase [Candidatus Gracilibacteria bacterium]